MSETKFGGKSGAHSEKFSLASEIFARLASEKNFDFFSIFFFKSNKISNK